MAQRPIRILIAKPGLDGHDRGAKVVARALRDAGMEVIYSGLRQTPEQIVSSAIQEDVDCIGLSILSGAHNVLFPEIMRLLEEKGGADLPGLGFTLTAKPDRIDELPDGSLHILDYKTGRLAQNRLTLGDPILFGEADAQLVILAAVLASREEDRDAIDLAVLEGLKDREALKTHRQKSFIPFDPIHKRTEAAIEDGAGSIRL